jgi:hypothetical protein
VPLNDTGRNQLLSGGLGNAVSHISVHSDIPDGTGSNELAGGSYARQAVAWAVAASGQRSNSGALSHSIGAGQVAAHYGLWSAASGGTYYGSVPRTGAGEELSGIGSVDAGDVTANAITAPAHALANGMRVALSALLGGSLPAGLSASTLYYVVGAATDSFQVALTSGGAAVDITGKGLLLWQRVVPEAFASAGTLSTGIGALVLDGRAT